MSQNSSIVGLVLFIVIDALDTNNHKHLLSSLQCVTATKEAMFDSEFYEISLFTVACTTDIRRNSSA